MEWTIRRAPWFIKAKETYKIEISLLVDRPDLTESEAQAILIDADSLKVFIQKIDHFESQRTDPIGLLPPARENLRRIRNYYRIRQGNWYGYYFRNFLETEVIGILLFHKKNRPDQLKATLEEARQLHLKQGL